MLLTSLIESSYTGFNFFVLMFCALCSALLLYNTIHLQNRDYRRFFLYAGVIILVLSTVLTTVPMQTNATAEIHVDQKPDTYAIEEFEYNHQYNSEIRINATDSDVYQIKVFDRNSNTPVSTVERLENVPNATVELPETNDTENITIISYDRSGGVVEETEIQIQTTVNRTSVL